MYIPPILQLDRLSWASVQLTKWVVWTSGTLWTEREEKRKERNQALHCLNNHCSPFRKLTITRFRVLPQPIAQVTGYDFSRIVAGRCRSIHWWTDGCAERAGRAVQIGRCECCLDGLQGSSHNSWHSRILFIISYHKTFSWEIPHNPLPGVRFLTLRERHASGGWRLSGTQPDVRSCRRLGWRVGWVGVVTAGWAGTARVTGLTLIRAGWSSDWQVMAGEQLG